MTRETKVTAQAGPFKGKEMLFGECLDQNLCSWCMDPNPAVPHDKSFLCPWNKRNQLGKKKGDEGRQ